MRSIDHPDPPVSGFYDAAETWTLLPRDEITLEALHMKCQCQIIHIHWTQHIANAEVFARTGLPRGIHQKTTLFGYIVRLTHGAPAHDALHCQVGLISRQNDLYEVYSHVP